jgi:Fe-Mn family superoxide dismutase
MDILQDRRSFMKIAAGAGAALALSSVHSSVAFAQDAPPAQNKIDMLKLPYAENALEPAISARTVNVHYNKHHKVYYNLLKAYVDSHPDYQNLTLVELIQKNNKGILLDETIFDISVLLYNHNRYWQSLAPKAGGVPKGTMEKHIAASFGSYDAFRKAFIDEGMKLGSGWVWIVLDSGKLKIYRSEYHDSPLMKGYLPLLAIDVWEHAYYLDYQNERQKYIEAVLDHLLNWKFAEKLVEAVKK